MTSGYLIVGLGNPGPDYELTRHNAGFLALDYLADQHGWPLTSEKWQGICGSGRLGSQRVFLVKPQTYMNRSGECAARFAEFHRIGPEGILVLHDDLDLPAGKIKVAAKGGAGGHNGIRSLMQHLGSADFARLKIGIGRPPRNEQGQGVPVDCYVLSAFSGEELELFNSRLPLIQEAVELFVSQGAERCMNQINGRATAAEQQRP
uniref:aminoacyl-tRNA hydrolase n=1 Tax=Candidatus Electronema sp. TaxID=2698783 RepID=UPI004056992E